MGAVKWVKGTSCHFTSLVTLYGVVVRFQFATCDFSKVCLISDVHIYNRRLS